MGSFEHPSRSVLLFVASLASPALAVAQGEEISAPWAVEAPGIAGSRFGLGLGLFFERQESLRIVRLERAIRTRDLGSCDEESGVVREDPALLNRKFDILLELEGVGSELAVALPSVGAPGAFQLFPTLVAQAAWADVRLDFHDRIRAEDSTSYEGRGPLFATGLDLTAMLCRNCPWFAGASYRFQTLPSLSVDRSPAFSPSGFAVLDDDVRLSRDVQEISSRVGYSFSGNRFASYLGVRHRWTDLEMEDELRYRDPLGRTETSLSSRTDLESEVTQALAGVEAHLGGGFYGRIETGISDEDYGAWMQVVYLPVKPTPSRKTGEIAKRIAPRLAAVEEAFLKGRQSLEVIEGPDGQPAYLTRELEDLLNKTEEDILAILGEFPELEALGDWVGDQFRAARTEIGLGAQEAGRIALASFKPKAGGFQWAQADRRTAVSRADPGLDRAERTTGFLKQRARLGSFEVELRITIDSSFGRTVSLFLFPRRNREAGKLRSPGKSTLDIGSYSWELSINRKLRLYCDGNTKKRDPDCPLDITTLATCIAVTCSQTGSTGASDSGDCKAGDC